MLPVDCELHARYEKDLLEGVTVLEGKAFSKYDSDWSNQAYGSEKLYKEIPAAPLKEFPIRLIPYHVWSNRGVSEMTVWLPVMHGIEKVSEK